jgi:hypothetical protein
MGGGSGVGLRHRIEPTTSGGIRSRAQRSDHPTIAHQVVSNALRLETYIQDAEREGDAELADFLRRAQAESHKGAEQGKQLLRSRLGAG